MKTIHLTCGHRIQVRTWPSKTGLAKVRHHYKKFHPARMKKMTRKSLATKRKRGLIRNRCNPISETRRLNCRLEATRLYREGKGVAHIWRYLKSKYHISQKDALKFAQQATAEAVWARSVNPAKKSVIIYDRLLGIEARKSHGKFKGQNFFHDFKKDTGTMVVGNPDGSLTIRSNKGKRLWKRFNY